VHANINLRYVIFLAATAALGGLLFGFDIAIITGVGADKDRVDEILKRLDLVHVEMQPGDGLFFHLNLLHRSDQNRSDHPRWGMICCYNAARNDPYMESHHPRYTPLVKVADEEIRKAGAKRFGGSEDKGVWLDPNRDASAERLKKNV